MTISPAAAHVLLLLPALNFVIIDFARHLHGIVVVYNYVLIAIILARGRVHHQILVVAPAVVVGATAAVVVVDAHSAGIGVVVVMCGR